MPKGKNQKMKLYHLARLLVEETDEDHELTMAEILKLLTDYGVTADRKSIYDDIDALREMGIEVGGRNAGRYYYYHVKKRGFELPELKLLVDAVQSSKFITEKASNDLIRKLMWFASKYERSELERQVVVQGRVKTMNESIYHNIDKLCCAIANNSNVRFEYLKWNLKKEMVLKRDQLYEVSPWGLTWDHENYYMIGFDKRAEKIKHYRVDKMRRIRMTGGEREGKSLFREFNLASYSKKNFGMFGGEDREVTIRFKNDLVGVMIDRFGKEIPINPTENGDWSETTVTVAVSSQFLGWIFSLGNDVKIMSPSDVVDKFKVEIWTRGELYA